MNPLLFLVGATASSKKRVAVSIAPALNATLLSLDSMKVYRGMTRGTDKAPGLTFLLTDIADPARPFSVGEYVRRASEEVERIRGAGRTPLFVGGTGLYLRALLRGLFQSPEIPADLRARLHEWVRENGSTQAHARLRLVDPVLADRIHPQDGKRIVRALEVHEATGRPLSDWQREHTHRAIAGDPIVVGIRWTPEELRQRIEKRVNRMLAEGLVEEVRQLSSEQQLGMVAAQAIGYREVLTHLQGTWDLERCRQEIMRATWALARRQGTWFRSIPDLHWVKGHTEEQELAGQVLEEFQGSRLQNQSISGSSQS